jgi:hypothetical protein
MPEHGPDVATGRPAATFNAYILKAVAMIASERAGQGYDLHSYFTRHLSYGPDNAEAIRSNHPPLTMCVAAVTEVMIEALNSIARKPATKPRSTSWPRRHGRAAQ